MDTATRPRPSVRQREDLQACVAHAQEAGRKYISVASYVLAGEK